MPVPGIQYIDQLDKHLADAVARFEAGAGQAGPEIFEGLLDLIGRLKTNRVGIVRSAENLKTVNLFRKEIDRLIEQSSYTPALQQYFTDFKAATGYINLYFSAIVTSFKPLPLYAEITTQYINVTADNLIGAGIQGYYRNAIIEILKTNVTTGGTMAGLREQLRAYVVDNESYGSYASLNRYASQVADDAINQYSRNYIQAVADDLELSYYFYKGTILSPAKESTGSRPFCISKAGKYFTKAEFEQWGRAAAAAESMGKRAWTGVYRGTNAQTIFTFLGGYKCRHRGVPITKEVYEKRVS